MFAAENKLRQAMELIEQLEGVSCTFEFDIDNNPRKSTKVLIVPDNSLRESEDLKDTIFLASCYVNTSTANEIARRIQRVWNDPKV